MIPMQRNVLMAALLCGAMALGACSFDTPTHVAPTSRAEVYQDTMTVQDDTDKITSEVTQLIAGHYRSYGDGTANVSVVFDPHSATNTAKRASEAADRISRDLKKQGVHDIRATTIPVPDSGARSVTTIAYSTIEAKAPSDCGEPLSMSFADIKLGKDYRLGCSVETYIAKQVARPKDLLGNDTMDNPDGKRATNVTEAYRAGVPNPALKGESASED